jgi:RimJ/RimL family protein N-acetyltransferase
VTEAALRHWPLFGLRVVTPRLEIRLADDEDLVALVDEIENGVHDPATMPFNIEWTDIPSPRRERESLQWFWRQRAEWSPQKWTFSGAVIIDGCPVGVQDLSADNFFKLRTVRTGSWLGMRHQGRGIGKEMRAAILHLAFAGLGAVEANSGAWHDNTPSLKVSEALGYEVNGVDIGLRRDRPERQFRLRLSREAWEQRRRDDIHIVGLDPCLELFGAI